MNVHVAILQILGEFSLNYTDWMNCNCVLKDCTTIANTLLNILLNNTDAKIYTDFMTIQY